MSGELVEAAEVKDNICVTVQILELNRNVKAQRGRIHELERCIVEMSKQVDDGRASQSKMLGLLESNASDLMSKTKQLSAYANTLHILSKKRKSLDIMVWQLKDDLQKKSAEWKCLQSSMQHEIEDLQSKLLLEKQKNIKVVGKHEHRCGCPNKSGTTDNCLTECASVDNEGSLKDGIQHITNIGLANKNMELASKEGNMKHVDFDHSLEEDKHGKSTTISKYNRTATTWIHTRGNSRSRGADPHDDFLDTPFESIMESLQKDKVVGAEQSVVTICNSLNQVPQYEMLPMTEDPAPMLKKMSRRSHGNITFKHVDTVRRKGEREHLKGIQCKQCKKFYDAILPNNEGKKDSTKGRLPCEHHHGVSRHRYKYSPPQTPEGFWNIGFDTEM